MRRSIIFAGFLLLLPAIGYAQHHGGAPAMSMMARPMATAPHMMAHAPAPVMRVSGGTRVASRATAPRVRVGGGPVRGVWRPRNSSNGSVFQRQFSNDESGAPGLGFDEVHFQATHPHRRDRDRFRNNNDFGAFFPFFDGGFFLPSSPIVDETGGEGQPEEVADNEAPGPPQHARTHLREQAEAPVISRDVAPEPPVKTDEYVFVRRDGTLFFAIAYAWDKGTIRYITADGLRRSVTRDSIDLDATQQFNEQRGLTFRVPA